MLLADGIEQGTTQTMSNDTALGRPGSGRIVPWFSRVAIGLSIATSAATVAGRFGQFAWPLELMSHFAVQLLAFQVIGLALLLICRRQRIAALFLPFALVNALVVAPYAFVPTWRAEAAPGPTRLVPSMHREGHAVRRTGNLRMVNRLEEIERRQRTVKGLQRHR